MLWEARRLSRRIRLLFLMGADQVALGILRVVYRRELAERPRNGAALAGLDENQALRDPVGVRRILIVLAAVILLFFLQGLLHLQPAAVALMGAAAASLWVRPGRRLTILVGVGVGCRAGRQRHADRRDDERDHCGVERENAHPDHNAFVASIRSPGYDRDVCCCQRAVRLDLRVDEPTVERALRFEDGAARKGVRITRERTVTLPAQRQSQRVLVSRPRQVGVAACCSRR